MREHHATTYIAAVAASLLLALAPVQAEAQGYYGQGISSSGGSVVNAVPVGKTRSINQGEASISVHESQGNDVGFAVPDTNGGMIWTPAPLRGKGGVSPDARELRLKVRELAAQLIAGMDPAYQNYVALPITFVNQENFNQTSTLGRFLAEQLLYEFSQRGFPVREYRLGKSVRTKGQEGEFLLQHAARGISAKQPGVVFVVGTYLIDRQAIFVNARLVRGNGHIIRAAQLVMPNSSITKRMLMSGRGGIGASGGANAKGRAWLPIEDFRTVTQPVNLTPIDKGEDIH